MKWLLVTVAVLLVIAITVGVTLFLTRGSGGGGASNTTSPTAGGDIASANDTGPVAIITSDQTCDSWRPIQRSLAASQTDSWANRDPATPSSQWTPDQRAQYEAVGKSMRAAADQVVTLAKQTPHRAMRELYEQFIAYSRAYADSLTSYTPDDDLLAHASVGFSSAIAGVCDAIQFGNAVLSASAVPAAQPPGHLAEVGDPSNPSRFASTSNAACSDWIKKDDAFATNLRDWESLNPDIPASQWSPEDRSTQEKAAGVIRDYADDIEDIGRASDNSVLEDLATLSALYLRAYSSATPTYTATDNYTVTPGLRINNGVRYGCQASAG